MNLTTNVILDITGKVIVLLSDPFAVWANVAEHAHSVPIDMASWAHRAHFLTISVRPHY